MPAASKAGSVNPAVLAQDQYGRSNAASLGAQLALLSSDERALTSRLAATAEHIDLSLAPEFQMEFGMAMRFPDGDVDTCSDIR